MNKVLLSLAGGLFGLFCMLTASATPIQTINMDTVYTGNIPDGSPPWLTATLGPGNGGLVLTLTSSLTGGDFLQGLQGKNGNGAVGWAFNFNGNITGISCDTGASTNCASHAEYGGNYNSGPVPGTFNLAFGWDSNSRFMLGDTAVYNIAFGSPPAQSFSTAITSTPYIAENSEGWSAVAHIQGIGANQSCSGWVVSGSGSGANGGQPCGDVPVAEPSELSIMLLGMTLLGGLYLLRRRFLA